MGTRSAPAPSPLRSSFLRELEPCSRPTAPYRTAQALPCGTLGSRICPGPCALLPPYKANFPFSRSLACCAPPLEPTLSGRFVSRVHSALLFLASL